MSEPMLPEQVLAQGYHDAGVLMFVMLAVVCAWAIALWSSEGQRSEK